LPLPCAAYAGRDLNRNEIELADLTSVAGRCEDEKAKEERAKAKTDSFTDNE